MDDDARLDNDYDKEEENDYDEDEEVLRGKWLMDGASTLEKAVARLRAFADHLESLEAAGWQLTGTVHDDWGFIRKSGTGALS